MGEGHDKANFNTLVETGNLRYWTTPALGAAVAVVSDGVAAAWAWSAYTVFVATAPADPIWLAGVFMCRPVVEAFYGDIAIASGAPAAEVDLAIIPFDEQLFAVVEGKSQITWLPYPIKITGAPPISTRIRKSTGASLAGVSMKILWATGIG